MYLRLYTWILILAGPLAGLALNHSISTLNKSFVDSKSTHHPIRRHLPYQPIDIEYVHAYTPTDFEGAWNSPLPADADTAIGEAMDEYEEMKAKQDYAIKDIRVNIKQISKNPITIKVTVENNSTLPITFFMGHSPLDGFAAALGLFKIRCDIPEVTFGQADLRIEYPSKVHPSTLAEIGPGMEVSRNTTIPTGQNKLNEKLVNLLKSENKVEVYMDGKWRGIWAVDKKSAVGRIRKESHWFRSNTIEIKN
ncbi:hypothetical protein F66182_7631 [Fusarium sp. NRRL 66182]|nr:hypothetical protein F66182_7631 [Fusarium sp. NRRL 66182]